MTSAEPMLAGVMGAPIGHSLSPVLHGHWIAERAMKAFYVPLPVAAQDLHAALRALPKLGFRGANLTLPHKEHARASMDELGPEVAHIGAVNTVIVGEAGRLIGRNTDAEGFQSAMIDAGLSATNGEVLILGAGGAARAVVYALWRMGSRQITLANRTRTRAEALALDLSRLDGLRISVTDWRALATLDAQVGLIVNTTAMGMTGQPPLEVPLERFDPDVAVSDIVYRPLMTPFLKAAAARGHRIMDGLGMLMHQGAPAFEAWFGVRPKVTPDLRRKLLQCLGET